MSLNTVGDSRTVLQGERKSAALSERREKRRRRRRRRIGVEGLFPQDRHSGEREEEEEEEEIHFFP